MFREIAANISVFLYCLKMVIGLKSHSRRYLDDRANTWRRSLALIQPSTCINMHIQTSATGKLCRLNWRFVMFTLSSHGKHAFVFYIFNSTCGLWQYRVCVHQDTLVPMEIEQHDAWCNRCINYCNVLSVETTAHWQLRIDTTARSQCRQHTQLKYLYL